MTVLDRRALNRAALARQLLLQRADRTALDAIGHLGGVQAQEPQEPFVGLWSRLRGFVPAELDALVTGRKAVRMVLMRRTMHLVTADDALAWRARHDAMLRQKVLGVYRQELAGVDLDELLEAGLAVVADGEPRTTAEVVAPLLERWPDAGPRALGEMVVAGMVPVVQAPPRGLWRTKAGVRHVPVAAWLGRDVDPLAPAPGADGAGSPVDPVACALVRRYLAAYGPAASADLRAWCGLAGLPAAWKAVRPELVSFRDERGRELLDLPDAPRPDPDTPAPVRYLPAFDNAILGYDDRSRIIDDEHRLLSVAGERVALVDGRVAATWTVESDAVVVTPLHRLSPSDCDELAEEGARLAGFLSDGTSSAVALRQP